MLATQTFEFGDLAIVGLLVLLEGLLSADNAIVLALTVRQLPQKQQGKALTYGLLGAFVFRAALILAASLILRLWWLQAAGAVYLIALMIRHFLSTDRNAPNKKRTDGFWRTVLAVELTDIAFALDSVLAGVAMIRSTGKLWVVYVGGITGVVLLRFAAKGFTSLLRRFPALDHVAYLLVAWAGANMALSAAASLKRNDPGLMPFPVSEMPLPVFWGVMTAVAVSGTLIAVRVTRSATPTSDGAESDATRRSIG
jgi:YkoY family integral membrane protein